MKTLKFGLFVLIAVGMATSAFAAGAGEKMGVNASWNMDQGGITTYPKAHEARVQHTPEHITNLDKQGKPWFQSTLNPQNVRREDSKPNIMNIFDARK